MLPNVPICIIGIVKEKENVQMGGKQRKEKKKKKIQKRKTWKQSFINGEGRRDCREDKGMREKNPS